jgi:multicomponent Na+:H+ antiporter subunit C
MSVPIAYAYASMILILSGIWGALGCEHILRRIMALNILGSGVFLLLVVFAYRSPDIPPDPVPHAMVLTGIVVAVSATALGLSLARRIPATLDGAPPRLPDKDASRADPWPAGRDEEA